MARPKHIHQYHRIYPHGLHGKYMSKMSGVWACALPDCTHYMPHNVAAQVEGKLSLCNTCMEPFVLDEENMKDDKPQCNKCLHPENVVNVDWDNDVNMERDFAKSYIVKETGKAFADITEAEIVERIEKYHKFGQW